MKKMMFLVMLIVGVTAAGAETVDVVKVLEKTERYIERHKVADVKAVYEFFIDLIGAPVSAEGCKDGVFTGESIYDAYGYKHVISLTVRDEKIVSAAYDEVKKDGHGKRGDKKYCAEMKKGSGASPAEAYPAYENQLLKTQDLQKIDAVSGASYSLYRFRSAAVRALLKAKRNEG